MPIAAIATIKGWFNRGKYPTDEQFWTWLDSFWHKQEKLPVASVDGLTELLNSIPSEDAINALLGQLVPDVVTHNDSSYIIPAGKNVYLMRFEADTDKTITVTDDQGEDLLGEINVAANTPFALQCAIAAGNNNSKTISIHGNTANITIRIYKI